VKAKIRALTRRTSQQDLEYVLTRINQILGGWAAYFRYSVAQHVFDKLDHFTWWRLMRMLSTRHHWNWGDVRRRYTTPDGHWLPITAGEVTHKRIAAVPVLRYYYRGSKIPSPWPADATA
jgi:RNA-directed DNA polymerase